MDWRGVKKSEEKWSGIKECKQHENTVPVVKLAGTAIINENKNWKTATHPFK